MLTLYIFSLFLSLAIVVKKEKPVTVKKEPLDTTKPAALPQIQAAPPPTLPSASSPSLATSTPVTSASSSPRTAIPTDPQELVAFLLRDDNKNKEELIRKIQVLTHNAKLLGEKDKGSAIQAVKPHATGTVSTVGVANPARANMKTSSTSTTSSKSPKVLTASPSSVLKSGGTALGKQPKVSLSPVLKTVGSGPHVAEHARSASLPSLLISDKKKRKKPIKDSVATTSSKTGSPNTSHILTTTTGQQYIFQWANSGGQPSVLKLISKSPNTTSLQPTSPSTPAATIVTTSDGRLLFTGGLQQLNTTITQTGLPSMSMATVKPSQGGRLVEAVRGVKTGGQNSSSLLKGNASPTKNSSSVVQSSGPRSLSLKQHSTSLASVKTTPVIELPRVASHSVAKSAPASSPKIVPALATNTKATAPAATITASVLPSPLTSSSTPQSVALVSTPRLPQQEKIVPTSLPVVPQVQSERVLTIQPSQAAKTTAAAVNNLWNTSATVGVSATTGNMVFVKPGATQMPAVSLEIPPMSKLVSSTEQVSSCVTQKLSLAGMQSQATRNMPLSLVGGQASTIPETPPQGTTTHSLQQKEPSPLKSPVEQIMEEHSYLGCYSSQQQHALPQQLQADQSPWPLHFQHTSPPQQTAGENAAQPHLQGHN